MSDPKPDRRTDSSPYGPQPERVDEAAGGADSTPFETLPSGEKGPAAERRTASGSVGPDPGGATRRPRS